MTWAWNAVVIGWTVVAGAGASLAYVFYRAALTDQAVTEARSSSEEQRLIARRIVRVARTRLLAFSAYIVAAGALWGIGPPVNEELLVRLIVAHGAFIGVGVMAIVATFQDGIDILDLFQREQNAKTHERPPYPPV